MHPTPDPGHRNHRAPAPTAVVRHGVGVGSTVVDGLVLGRALAFGIGVTLVSGALVWAAGLLPAGTTGYVALGGGAALLSVVIAAWLHGRFLDPRATAPFAGDGRLMAGRLQSLLAAAFGVKLAALVVGVLTLRQSGAKFAELGAFCIAFAGVALVCQSATAGYLARVMNRRPLPPATSHPQGRLPAAADAGASSHPTSSS